MKTAKPIAKEDAIRVGNNILLTLQEHGPKLKRGQIKGFIHETWVTLKLVGQLLQGLKVQRFVRSDSNGHWALTSYGTSKATGLRGAQAQAQARLPTPVLIPPPSGTGLRPMPVPPGLNTIDSTKVAASYRLKQLTMDEYAALATTLSACGIKQPAVAHVILRTLNLQLPDEIQRKHERSQQYLR